MSKQEKTYFEILIERYKDGSITEQQRLELDQFLEHHYNNPSWDITTLGDKDQLKRKIQQQIHRRTKKKVIQLKPIYYAAATVVVLFGLFMLLKKDDQYVRFATTTHIDSLKLSDGSKIILSPGSLLEYPEEFGGDQRLVRLIKGNAFFQIARDTIHPFIVKQADLSTRVLGTSFNIGATETGASVDVRSGKVEVSAGLNQKAILVKGQSVVFDIKKQSLLKSPTSDLPNWYGANISLQNITIRGLSKFLSLRYGYELSLQDASLYENKLSIHISVQDDIQDVIEQLNYITNLHFKINANGITVN